jgi:hypothetical protein
LLETNEVHILWGTAHRYGPVASACERIFGM